MTLAVVATTVVCLVGLAIPTVLWLSQRDPKPVQPDQHYRRPRTPGYQGRHWVAKPKRPSTLRAWLTVLIGASWMKLKTAALAAATFAAGIATGAALAGGLVWWATGPRKVGAR